MPHLFHELILNTANRGIDNDALVYQGNRLSYTALAHEVELVANALLACGLERSERLAVYLEKRFETVTAMFGTSAAGGVFVPINPLFKAEQEAHICLRKD